MNDDKLTELVFGDAISNLKGYLTLEQPPMDPALSQSIRDAFDVIIESWDDPFTLEFYSENGESMCAQNRTGDVIRYFVRREDGRWAYVAKTCYVGSGSKLEKELTTQYNAYILRMTTT